MSLARKIEDVLERLYIRNDWVNMGYIVREASTLVEVGSWKDLPGKDSTRAGAGV